jgi:hypothetical protein
VKRLAPLQQRMVLPTLLVGLLTVSVLGMPAGAAPSQKVYSVVISPQPDVGAGQTREFTFTATNNSGSQSLGSINVTAPAGFTLLAVTQQPAVGTAAIASTTLLELRNLALAPSASATAKFTAEAPCDPGAYQWGLAAKQSNDFKGTRNDFTLREATSDRVTDVTPSCQLNWTSQPASSKVSTPGDPQAITSTNYDAVDGSVDGPSIAVEVLSAPYADSSPATRVSFSTDVVTLEIGHDPNGGTAQLTGTITDTASSGVAEFAPGPRINLHGLDYTLAATNPNMTDGVSAAFDMSDAVGRCGEGECDDLATNGNNVNAHLSSNSTSGILAMSIGVLPSLTCEGYTPNEDQEAVTILPLGPSEGSTMTLEIIVQAGIVDRAASQYLICWASTTQFTDRNGDPAQPVTISGDAMFKGLLSDCANRDPVAPCQIRPSRQDRQGNVHLFAFAPTDDPHAR